MEVGKWALRASFCTLFLSTGSVSSLPENEALSQGILRNSQTTSCKENTDSLCKGAGWERNPRLFQETQGDIPEMTSPLARRGREDLPPRSLYPAKTRSVTQPCVQPGLLSRHQDTQRGPARRVRMGATLPPPFAS